MLAAASRNLDNPVMPLTLADVRLETPRLVLRELALEDVPAVQRWATDPEVYRYMPWGPNTMGQSAEFLRTALAARREEPRRTFELGFARKESGELIGAGGCRIRSTVHLEGDIGYVLRRDAWGNGYATEGAAALVEFGIRVLGLHRIWATCHVDNARSARVLERIGMQREGRLRDHVRARGAWRDSYLYAAIDGDGGLRSVLIG